MKHNSITIEPTVKLESTLSRVIESNIPAATLQDILNKYEISTDLLVKLLNKYFSSKQLREIDSFVATELDVDEEILEESIDLSTSNLINKMDRSELKNMVKDAGVNLDGSESKEELTGIVKGLSATEGKEPAEDEALTEAGFLPEYIGGYKAEVFFKLPEEIDVDKFANEIKECIASGTKGEYLERAVVDEVLISQLHKGLFENKKLSKFVKIKSEG